MCGDQGELEEHKHTKHKHDPVLQIWDGAQRSGQWKMLFKFVV